MTNKFEQLLDYLVNEEMDKANELFHEIVVEKSRDIYENLIAEEAAEDEEEMDEAQEDDEEDDEEELDEETTLEIGGDPTDAMAGDMGAPGADMGDDGMGDMDDPMGGDDMAGDIGGEGGSTEDRIDDLEDALEELKAEFEALMADEEHEPEHSDGEDDPDFGGEEGDNEEGEENPFGDEEDDSEDDEEDDEEDEGMFENRQRVREYRDTVGNDWEKNSMKTPGPVGSGKGDKAGQTDVSNLKSPVSSGKGKPTTGATAHNILASTKGVGEMSGTSPNMDKGSRGLVGATKGEFTKGVEKNISNKANSSMKSGAALSKVSGGHGAEKKGTGGEGQGWGSGSGGKTGQTGSVNTKSPLTGAPNRNA